VHVVGLDEARGGLGNGGLGAGGALLCFTLVADGLGAEAALFLRRALDGPERGSRRSGCELTMRLVTSGVGGDPGAGALAAGGVLGRSIRDS